MSHPVRPLAARPGPVGLRPGTRRWRGGSFFGTSAAPLLAGLMLLGLTACGGASPAADAEADAEASESVAEAPQALAQLALFEQVAQAQLEVQARRQPAYTDPASGASWDWVLSLPPGVEGDGFNLSLSPTRGRGYAEPVLRLAARGGRVTDLRETPRPDCRSDTRCDFSGPGRFSMSLPPDAPLRAVPRGDGVALVARVMSVDQAVEVTLRLSAEGRSDGTRQIVLLP